MKIYLGILLSLFGLLLYGDLTQTYAQATPTSTCKPIFGGGETCKSSGNLIIDKTIKNPATNSFVNSLPQNVALTSGQELTFQITLTNNNNSNIANITITDNLPQYLNYVGGAGNFNKDKREVIISLDKLEGNATKSYVIVTRIVNENALPKDKNTTCIANQAQVKAGTRVSADNVQFCISKDGQATQGTSSFPTLEPKPVTMTQPTTKGGQTIYPTPGVKNSPSTGPEMLGLIALLPAAGAGLYLRKRTHAN